MDLITQIEIVQNRLNMALSEGNVTEAKVWESILDTLKNKTLKENKNDF